MPHRVVLLAAVLSTLFLYGCDERAAVRVAGSSTVLPVISRAAEQFRVDHPEVNVIVNAGGSGVGINQLGEGKIDVGMSSRELTAAERDRYPEADFRIHAVGLDAVVPAVSSEIYEAGVTSLSLDQIADIYRGEIGNWRGVGGPDRDILVVDKEASRGTRHVFMEAVFGDGGAEAPGADLVLGSNNEEQTAVTQSDAAIGMLSVAWLNEDVRGLAIDTEDSSVVSPTPERMAAGKYPITRELLLITTGTPEGSARQFLEFLLSADGQRIVEEAGYVRLR
ncbi:MAG: phosphate ABC transporter substrate-binding protein [Rhodothermales bacterium]